MEIVRGTERIARMGPEAYFVGSVTITDIVSAPEPARLRALNVRFQSGARTNWHTHPLGQTLFVTEGVGRVQSRGGPMRMIRAGDTVWIPPGEEHWHGAAPDHPMTHIAMQESLEGSEVTWLDPVSDVDYGVSPVGD